MLHVHLQSCNVIVEWDCNIKTLTNQSTLKYVQIDLKPTWYWMKHMLVC